MRNISIAASIIQGSAIGLTSYVANAITHQTFVQSITAMNYICKYADDTYLIVPAVNINTRASELKNRPITEWATTNNLYLFFYNLSLNFSKSGKIVFVCERKKHNFDIPNILYGLRRVQNIKMLGVTFKFKFKFKFIEQQRARSHLQLGC